MGFIQTWTGKMVYYPDQQMHNIDLLILFYICCEFVGLDNKLYEMHDTYIKIGNMVFYQDHKTSHSLLEAYPDDMRSWTQAHWISEKVSPSTLHHQISILRSFCLNYPQAASCIPHLSQSFLHTLNISSFIFIPWPVALKNPTQCKVGQLPSTLQFYP